MYIHYFGTCTSVCVHCFSAYTYNKQFTSDFRFENHYITSYFLWIDRRRALQAKTTLLPLKKAEKKHCSTVRGLKLTAEERSKLVSIKEKYRFYLLPRVWCYFASSLQLFGC